MTRQQLEQHILNTYGTSPEYPWMSAPMHAVFRHGDNRKWFAIVMNVKSSVLGISGGGLTDVVNLKCSTDAVYPLLSQKGIYPAYHMNKQHWVTVLLSEADDELILSLLRLSFSLTKTKTKPR